MISDNYAQPYIFALYYSRTPPNQFLKTVNYNPVDKWGFSTVASFNNLVFKKIGNADLITGNLVFAAPDDDLVFRVNPSSEIKFLDGSIAFYIYEN